MWDKLILRPKLFITIIGLVAFLPFVNRPVFVDDHAVFEEAQNLSKHLSLPYPGESGALGWEKGKPPSETNPLVALYLLALVIKFFGNEPWKSHLLFVPFHIVALLCFFSLARRYTRYSLWAVFLWLVSPHFFLTANSLLPDALLASVMLLGITFWLTGWENRKIVLLIVGAIFLGLAPLVKYTGILAWAVCFLWILFESEKKKTAYWAAFLIPCIIFMGWNFWTKAVYGQSHVTAVARGVMIWPSPWKAVLLASFASGTITCLLIPTFLVFSRSFPVGTITTTTLLLSGMMVGALLGFKATIGLQMGFWVGVFLVWIWTILPWRMTHQRQWYFLMLWAGTGFIGLFFGIDWICARYLVVVSPPIVLLTVMALERRAPALMANSQFRFISLAILALFCFLLARADYEQATVDYKAARDTKAWLAMNNHYANGYYPGAMLSGIGYYLDKDVWKPSQPGETIPPGSIAILPLRTLPFRFLPQTNNVRFLTRFVYTSMIPLRTLDSVSGAGFYGSVWGPLPFSFSYGPMEVFTLVQERG